MSRRTKPAPDFRDEASSLAALYGAGDAQSGREESARARRLADLIATAHRRDLDDSERDELSRLVAGKEPSTKTDEAKS